MTTYNTTSSKPFDMIDRLLHLAAYYECLLIKVGGSAILMERMDHYWDLAVELDEESRL